MRKFIFLFSIFMFSFVYVMGQTDIKGMVFESKTNEPLAGVGVLVKGTTQGVTTDQHGAFQLRVKPTDILVFKYLGFQEKEITVGSKTFIDVVMETSDIMLEEAVVTTAMNIKRDQRALGYAISTVKNEDLVKAGATANPLASLYGKASGVGVQATAAGPMGGMKINIRGAQGLESSSNTRPLFVVDGVPMFDKESSMSSRGYDPLNSFDYGSAINDINVDDIEAMEILKGAKAAVLYGSDGANGVVLITTKRGSGTRGLGVQISYGQEWEIPYSLINFQNEYGSGENEYARSYEDEDNTIRRVVSSRYNFGPKFDGSPIKFFDGTTNPYLPYKNNYLDMFNQGGSTNFSAAISGGNEKGNMRLAFTNMKYTGLTPNQGQVKNSLSFNGQMNVSNFVRFEFVQNLYSTKSTNRLSNISHLVAWGTFNRDYDINAAKKAYKDENGYMYTMQQLGSINDSGWGWPTAFVYERPNTFFHMMWNMNENRNIDERVNSLTSAKAVFQFLPSLSLTLQGGLNYTDTDFTKKNKVMQRNEQTGKYEGGQFSFARERTNIQNYDAFVTFDKSFIDNKLSIISFIGPSYKKVDYTYVGVGTIGNFKFPDFWSLTNSDSWPSAYDTRVSNYAREGEALYRVSGQAEVRWGMEYILEFTAANDWTSTLPKKNRSYFYPGASFTWNFTETFDIPFINYGKFRTSWADVGRKANRYYALATYSINTLPPPNTNVNDITGPGDLFSGDLKPERKREFEIGFDTRMLKNRLEFNFSYYNHSWYNQIMGVPLSAPTGAQIIRINAGKINNRGLEFYLKGSPISTNHFQWELSYTAAKQWDKIIRLYPGITQKNESSGNLIRRKEEGERMNTLWIQDYLKDENGVRIVNSDGFYQLSNRIEDEICLGSTNTDIYGGLISNFYFKGRWGMVNLMGGLDYKFGGKILSYSNFYLTGNGLTKETLPFRDTAHGGLTWTETLADGTTRERHDGLILPGVTEDGEENTKVISAQRYYQSYIHDMGTGWQPDMIKENSYIKFREAAIAYTFPKQFSEKLRVQKLTVALTARNLFYLYKTVKNIDAESMLGSGNGNDSWTENSSYPSSRSFGFKVNLSF